MRPATEVFSEWAQLGKDVGMETGHAPAVKEILEAAIEQFEGRDFTAIDAGCGNGWVVRLLNGMPNCTQAMGVDGATSMIERAKAIDIEGTYVQADLSMWNPQHPVELVHSMEVLYYLEDIPAFLNHVNQYWLNKDGIFAFGIDHYFENEDCHGWSEKVGVRMAMHSQNEWKNMVEDAGFEVIRMFRSAQTSEWAGTLSFILRKNL